MGDAHAISVRLINDHHAVMEVEGELLANVPVHDVVVGHQHELRFDHDHVITGQEVGAHLQWRHIAATTLCRFP